MKQSTSFAQVANNLLTVLQGYSKTIRLLLVMFLTLTVSANAWGQTWTRVTTMEQLTSGGTFIMGYEATAKSGTIVPLRSADCNATTSANGYFHTGTTANSSTNSTITMSSVVNTSAYEVYISSPASGKINIQRATSTGNYYGASSEGSSKNTARLYTEGNTTETNLIVEWASETNNQFKLKTGVLGAYKYLKYNTSAPRFAFYNSAGEKIVFYKKSAPAYTITATSNNDSYGTVSVSGTTITATPNAGYRVKSGDAGYTVTSGTADVTNNGDNTFSVTPSSNCTITINFEAIPTHQIIFNTGGLNVIAPISVAEGSTYNITQEPTGLTNECEYNTFIGWTEESSIAEASTKPTLVESITMGSSDITLYAVYSKTEGGNSTTTNTSSDVTLKDGVYNSSVSTITWTIADVITIKQETNGAQTAVSSSYISAPRWYAGHMITMTPLVNITSIVVTATSESYASELQSSTYTNATASVSSTKVTITPITGTLPITIVLGKQSRISSITVNYSTSNAGATTYSLTPECSTETLVSLYPNGGTFATDPPEGWTKVGDNYVIKHTGTEILLPINISQENKNFVGWYDGETAYTIIPADLSESITLVAKWTAKTATSLTWSADTYTATIDADNTFPTLTIDPEAIKESVQYTSSDATVATISADGQTITLLKAGTTTITATFTETNTHAGSTASYTLTVNPSNCRWVEVTIDDIEYGDEVVVVMVHGETLYALPYDSEKASNSNPEAMEITTDYFAGTVDEMLIWYIMKGDDNNFTLSPKTADNKYLTCNSSNNAVRINTGEDRNFTIENDFLKNTKFSTYLAISTTATPKDWRHYESTNTTISNKFQTLKFYKRECLDPTEVWVEGNLTNVTCTQTLPQQIAKNGSLTLNFTAADDYALPDNVTVTNASKTWDKSTGTLTISNPTGNVMVTVEADKQYTITWNIAGDETLKTYVVEGSQVEFPDLDNDPTSCSDIYTTFVGWYTMASGMETSPSAEPQGEQVTASTIPTGNATYYAVWADAAAGGGEWEKVISFEIGDVVIFVNEEDSRELTGISDSDIGTATTFSTSPEGTYPLTVEAGSNGIGYSFKNGSDYLSWSSDNKLYTTTDKNNSSSWTISESTDGNYKFANVGTTERILQYNSNSGQEPWACYTSDQTTFQIYKQASSATGYISSCCQSPAVVTVTPADASLELNIDGTASTTVNISQTGSTSGTFSASVNGTATLEATNNATDNPYTLSFTATEAGEYTINGTFTDVTYGCPKYGSATITVAANPILQASAEALEFSPTCGQSSASQEVEINSRYLTSNSITATVATTGGSGQFTISTDNTTFGTSNLTLSGGTTTKVTDQIYVRYEAEEGETGAVAGTLTLKYGSTQQVINLTGTCTCSANVTITGAPIQITAAKGVWVEAATELTVTGTFLTTNADNANVSIRAYTNNAAFQIKNGGVTGDGAPKTASDNALTLNTNGAISTADWTGKIGIVYKPAQANTTETATLTVEVYRYNGSDIYSTATYELEGRSLPEQFVIAVTNGSGDWFAVPADMVAPWGESCSGLGTFAPYPISVDNTTAPTIASDVPARAVYQAAARTGYVNTNPQTMSYKSVPLGGNYYLYGSSTSVDSDGNNTHIQNASFASSEKQKWFLDVVDWNKKEYNMHVHNYLTTNVLCYTTAGGANRVGQYSATYGTTKKSIYLLPINGTTCTYYAAPVVTVMAIDATNATIQFKNDRTTAYEISLDQNTWTDLAVTLIKDCNNSEEATQLQAQLPLATYRGQTVYIRAKVTTGTACQETGSFVVPNPTIDRGDTPWKYTGTAGQAFSDNSKSITISDLWNPLSVSVAEQRTNSNIQASITPEGVVTVSMAAEDATEGVHEAVLQFISDGASFVDNGKGNPQYVGVQITLHSLALQEFDGGDTITFTETSPIMLCKNAIDENAATPTIYLAYPLYANGTAISTTSQLNQTSFSLVDLSTGAAITAFSREGSTGGVAKITFSASTLSEMVPGHTYRLSWENTNQVMTNAGGLPYMDCHMDFVYSENCDAPTALAACPITNSGFTANWVGDVNCTGNVTVDVYTRGAGTTLIDKTTFSTTEVKDLQYAGESNLSGSDWITNIEGTKGGAPSISSNRLLISDVSTPKYYNLFSPLLSNLGTINESTIYTITVTLYQQTSDAGAGAYFYVMDNGNNLTKNTTPTITNKSVTIDGQTATSKKLTYGTTTFTVKGLSSDDRIRFLGFESSSIASNKKNVYISSIKIESSGSIVPVATKTTSCNAGSAEFIGLSANTTYYYTVTDGSGNTSNEIAVTTYNGEPELKFYSDEACTTEITETTVLGGEETTVYVKGTRVPACDINASVSTGYGMDDSNISYTTGSGAVSGSIILTLTDANTTEGTLTITDAEGNDYVLNIVSSDCPAGFGTMALPATNITNELAQANWTTTLDFGDDKSGTLHLYKNGVVNRELIVNGDFETGSLDAGWSNGINNGEVGAAHSFDQYAIKNSSSEAYDGNYSLYVTADGSELTNFHGQSVMYADYITLTPGTYRMSAWVKMPIASGGYNDKTQYFSLGIITGENGSEHVYTVSTPVTVYSNNTYVQLTHEFEVTSTIKACPAIGASSGTFRYFYLDNVSLVCTSIGQSDEPYLSIDIADLSAGNLALKDLSGNTEYTYVIQNADGCSSNPITFQTTEAGAPVITPNDVTITCQVGNSTNGIMTLTVKDVYSDIYISNSCTERITLNTTQLPKEGGVVNFTFTPLNTDQGGKTGTCTISFTTKGLSTPATGIITWTVTAGVDPDLPIIDVTDITTTSLTIEHNEDGDNVQIVISREKQEDEIEDNIGEEIFFSKYYEAYMHKKLWAIYNPTKEKISLANTYVWRSNGKGTDWNIEGGLDLSQMGNIESGYIYPNEELIVYTSDQVGECEQSKADMTNWVAMSSSDPALSFSGNDALLLVRKDIDGDADNPPRESVELDSNGDPYELNWRHYTDAEGNSWWMLDIIGARQNNNKPDITATGSWTWTCNGKTEKGDAAGWYGDQGEHLNATLYKDCGYVLSTNRCLLIRKESVKSGYKAINENIGDMFTLGKNNYPTEWRGAHVPQDGNQEETSCENFAYVGGYDYESYYNAWTDLEGLQPAVMQKDSTWLVEGVNVPKYYCHPLLIEVLITDTVNGEEIQNVKSYVEYKVPIIIETTTTTDDDGVFVEPNPENILTPEICADCDVVIRDSAKLTHVSGGVAEFRNMQVYPTGRLEIPEGLSMQLAGLHMYAKNDEVGYAIINNDGSSIHAEEIIHIKRIDNMYWYPFSLPYDCKISSIRQLNGKTLGQFGKGGDWGIKYYDGQARQIAGDDYVAGKTSNFWKMLDANATLKANQGYIIGLFTPEGYTRMKSIYFPPVESTEYSEGAGESKTTSISNWSDNLTCEPRHRGWNFTALPYISQFSSSTGGANNNTSIMMGSQGDDYATSSTVYISIPDGGNSRTYTQVSAALATLYPFKPFFVQAIDPTDGQSHNDITLTYSKGGRTVDKLVARTASSKQPTIIVELQVANAEMSLSDNAGVLANDRYTEKYEIGADLMKMYAEDRKPQLFTRAINNEMMAYNALPDHLAQNIPLGIYLPNTDEYTISIIDYASQLSDAEAVYLLYNGEIVANLLYADYIVQVQQAGLINGYSLDIRRKQNTTTNINNLTDGAPVITIVDGQIVIQQLPDNAEVQIIDVLGRVLYQQANVPDIITFQAPATGVYNVVITTTEQQFTHKTIIH